MLADIATELYTEKPTKVLHHYTSLEGLLAIVEKRFLIASEIRYLNDAAELGHLGLWLDITAAQRIEQAPDGPHTKLLTQLREWLKMRLPSGPLIFVACFTENGNLLSQWRGYCPHGKGVSIGFDPRDLDRSLTPVGFRIGRCIYDNGAQAELAVEVLDAILKQSEGTERGQREAHPTQSYHPFFYEIEPDLLQIAALVKHSHFAEEAEWRAVSAAHSNYVKPEILYRPGETTLVPYLAAPLPTISDGTKLHAASVTVGPTPNANLSSQAVRMFMSRYADCRYTGYCGIPYRER